MDTDIEAIESSKRKSKTGWFILLGIVALVTLVWLLRLSISTSVKRKEIRFAVVEKGNIENTISASGEVQPEFEQVIISPISATIQKIFLESGHAVKEGDKILELDKEASLLNINKQSDQLELKRNGIAKLKLDLEKSFFDLKINDSIKAMEISSLKADLENAKRLEKAGGGTRESIESAEMNLRIAELKKKQLENDIRIKQQTMSMDIRESELSAQIQVKDLFEFQSKLKSANILANHNGVLTYVNKNLGAKVSEGEILARLADLGTYKIIGSISDTYAEQLKSGMPAIIKINETLIRGNLVNIEPSVQNNVLSFELDLEDAKNTLLRPKLKVEVFLVTASRTNIIRVENGPAFKGTPVQDIYVLDKNGNAERRTIKTGLSNFDYVEIVEGVLPGETIIISDLSEFKQAKELKIK